MFFQLNSYNLGIGVITPIFSWRNWGFERLSSLFADNRYWLKWLNLSRIIQLLSNKTGNRTPRSRLSSWPRYLKRTGSLAPNYYRLTTCNPTLNFTTNIPRWNYFFFLVLKKGDQLHYKHESGGFLCALQVRKSVNVSFLCVDAVEWRLFKISFEQTLPWGLDLQKAQGPMFGGVERGRGMIVLPGEWPFWSPEFRMLDFSGTFACAPGSFRTALGSEIAFSARHLPYPQGGWLISASVWIYLLQLTPSLLKPLFHVAPKASFCPFPPSYNVLLQLLPPVVHTFHQFS